MAKTTLLSALLLTTLSLLPPTTTALPTATITPEVIPGPGLPSLASLNLTSADLSTRALPDAFAAHDPESTVAKRFQLMCTGPEATASEAISCINYLSALGGTPCTVTHPVGGETVFCTVGHTHIKGHNIGGGDQTSSACVDVARGAGQIMDKCTIFEPPEGNLVAGANAANGNGDLVVIIESVGGL